MKKIIMDNGEICFEGEAGVNSISFIGYKEDGPISIKAPGVIARIDENGEISCKSLKTYEKEHSMLYQKMEGMKKKYTKLFYVTNLIFFIASIVSIFTFPKLTNLIYAMFLFFFGCTWGAGAIGMFFERMKGNKDIISMMKFHSAEHAVINAYNDLKRVPTLDEIKNYSRFSYNCGSLENMNYLLTFWLFAITRFLPKLWYLAVLVILLISTFYFKKRKRLFFMEFLVTKKPTDKEYRVAIAGLESAIKEIEDIADTIQVEVAEIIPVDIGDILKNFVNHKFSEEKCKECPFYTLCKEEAEKSKNN